VTEPKGRRRARSDYSPFCVVSAWMGEQILMVVDENLKTRWVLLSSNCNTAVRGRVGKGYCKFQGGVKKIIQMI